MDASSLVDNALVSANSVNRSLGATDNRAEALEPLPTRTVESESRFYRRYSWSIQVFPQLREIVKRLRLELKHLSNVEEEWQRQEVETNIFLFGCAIAESVDDFLLGKTWDFSKAAVPLAGTLLRSAGILHEKQRRVRERCFRQTFNWREAWDRALGAFIERLPDQKDKPPILDHPSVKELQSLLEFSFPRTLLDSRPRIPAAFHGQDLTPSDIVMLARKFAEIAPDRKQPILVVGLRTAGSYFAPVLRAYLASQGYEDLDSVTIRPKSGVGYWEMRCLKQAADKKATAIVIDEPGATGSTYARGVDYVRRAGFANDNIVALIPVHPTVRDWREKPGYLRLSQVRMLSLEPEEYHKHKFLQLEFAQKYLSLCFRRLGYVEVNILEGSRTDDINRDLAGLSEENSQNRFKRVYQVDLRKENGDREVRFVVAKSVGWGWFSYHAFLAGEHLAGFVPPILGLRNGFLYSEWLDHKGNHTGPIQQERVIETAASYIATRFEKLRLADDPTEALAGEGRHFGTEKFSDHLCKAYGGRALAGLRRPRIRRELARRRVPYPTFIDGRMRRLEWIEGQGVLYKSDFEQHGLGKYELSITDPAHDIAEVILNFGLSANEEEELIKRYVSYSKDEDVRQRLFLNKVQAGTWAMSRALSNLTDSRLVHRHGEFHKRFTEAWNFLTIHTARRCGSLCRPGHEVGWKSPIVVLDIDGVLDRHVFGFPSTTYAGIRALSLLHSHGFTVALDTARTIEEVKEYCRAYGFAGGVAEYGAWAWDAVTGKEVVLVCQEDREQLGELAQQLRDIPGVFVNDGYRYSLRAYTYGPNGTVPLPQPLIETLISGRRLHRLRFHQTSIDTAVTARAVDKGKGLMALKALVGQEKAETVAVGDTESDLPMFAVSHRLYAPDNMKSCRPTARSMGCRVVSGRYQVGLLQIAQAIVHQGRGRCNQCNSWKASKRTKEQDLFLDLLRTADQSRLVRLLTALLDPLSFRAFIK